jgi:hypothetical protein
MRNSESGVAMERKDQSKKKTELKKDLGKDGGFKREELRRKGTVLH